MTNIVEFFYYYFPEHTKTYWAKQLAKHLESGTLVTLTTTTGDIMAAGRFNVLGTRIHVLDVAVDPLLRGFGTLKYMLGLVLFQFPGVTHIAYRRRKYQDRPYYFNINKFLKLKEETIT